MMFLLLSVLAFSQVEITLADEKAFVKYMKDQSVCFVGEEYSLRLGIFMANMRYIKEFNKGEHKFRLGITKFMHFTPSEYYSILGSRPSRRDSRRSSEADISLYPANDDVELKKRIENLKNKKGQYVYSVGTNYYSDFDFRDRNAVQPVQDQGNCGASWAFAAIGAQETNRMYQETGYLEKLSEQCFIDCVRTNDGCNSGDAYNAYTWERYHQNHLTMADKDYRPYEAAQGECQFNGSIATSLLNVYLKMGNDHMEQEYMMHIYITEYGSVCSHIDASSASFMLYNDGIFDETSCSTTEYNHCVHVVGFGHIDDWEEEYWIVRNSFGKAWGVEGYIRFGMFQNICGISQNALIPICCPYGQKKSN